MNTEIVNRLNYVLGCIDAVMLTTAKKCSALEVASDVLRAILDKVEQENDNKTI